MFKKNIDKFKAKFKELSKNFPITLILIYALTIFFVVCETEISETTFFTLILCVIESYFFESLKLKRKTKYLLYLIPVATIPIFHTLFNQLDVRIAYNLGITLIIILLGIIIYNSTKNRDIREYSSNVFRDLFYTTISYILIAVGLTIIVVLSILLIFTKFNFNLLYRIILMPLGLYYIPSLIQILKGENDDDDKFIKKLVLYILNPIILIALIIIYLYSLKIIITKSIPENLITRVLIIIYIFTIQEYILSFKYKDEKISKIGLILPYIYAPLIILETYSLMIRISAFGLTPMRYLSLLFIIFEIISLFLIVYKEGKKLNYIVPIIMIISALYLVSPLNYINISLWSQEKILDKFIHSNIPINDYNSKDLNKIKGAYFYLNDEPLAKKYLTNSKNSKLDELKNTDSYIDDVDEFDKVMLIYNANMRMLDVAKYKYISYFESEGRNKISVNDENRTFDLTDLVNDIASSCNTDDDVEKYFKNKKVIQIDDNTSVYITYLVIEKNDNAIKSIFIKGYLLYS